MPLQALTHHRHLLLALQAKHRRKRVFQRDLVKPYVNTMWKLGTVNLDHLVSFTIHLTGLHRRQTVLLAPRAFLCVRYDTVSSFSILVWFDMTIYNLNWLKTCTLLLLSLHVQASLCSWAAIRFFCLEIFVCILFRRFITLNFMLWFSFWGFFPIAMLMFHC